MRMCLHVTTASSDHLILCENKGFVRSTAHLQRQQRTHTNQDTMSQQAQGQGSSMVSNAASNDCKIHLQLDNTTKHG